MGPFSKFKTVLAWNEQTSCHPVTYELYRELRIPPGLRFDPCCQGRLETQEFPQEGNTVGTFEWLEVKGGTPLVVPPCGQRSRCRARVYEERAPGAVVVVPRRLLNSYF